MVSWYNYTIKFLCLLIIHIICQQLEYIHQEHLQATTFSDVLYQGLCNKLLLGNKAKLKVSELNSINEFLNFWKLLKVLINVLSNNKPVLMHLLST